MCCETKTSLSLNQLCNQLTRSNWCTVIFRTFFEETQCHLNFDVLPKFHALDLVHAFIHICHTFVQTIVQIAVFKI